MMYDIELGCLIYKINVMCTLYDFEIWYTQIGLINLRLSRATTLDIRVGYYDRAGRLILLDIRVGCYVQVRRLLSLDI